MYCTALFCVIRKTDHCVRPLEGVRSKSSWAELVTTEATQLFSYQTCNFLTVIFLTYSWSLLMMGWLWIKIHIFTSKIFTLNLEFWSLSDSSEIDFKYLVIIIQILNYVFLTPLLPTHRWQQFKKCPLLLSGVLCQTKLHINLPTLKTQGCQKGSFNIFYIFCKRKETKLQIAK